MNFRFIYDNFNTCLKTKGKDNIMTLSVDL